MLKVEIKRINTPSGRFYETPDGVFPSVTTVLSSIPSPELEAWKVAVGAEVADKITRNAANRGTRLHEYCEQYLKGERPVLDPFDRQMFSSIVFHLDRIEPMMQEQMVWSKKLKVAGTFDCLGKYDGELTLIDFKSSSREKYPGEFDSYWLQLAAYAVMIYERYGIVVNKTMIIMQLDSGDTNVYYSTASRWLARFQDARHAFDNQFSLLPK